MTEALIELHRTHGATLAETPGGALPLRYGGLAEEVEVFGSGTGILDLEAAGTILLRGPEAEVYLDGIVSHDVKGQPMGTLRHHLLCANKGKILFDIQLLRTKPGEFLLLTEPGELQGVANHLDFYHVREEFQMGAAGLARLDLIGTGIPELLAGLSIAEHSVEGRFREGPLVTVPAPLDGLPRTIALLPPANAPPLVEALLGASPPARLVGFEAYDEARIWAGMPRFGPDYSRDFLPGEAALYTHLSFDKGCYVGQETHARMHHRGHPNRKLTGVELAEADAAPLEPGAELFHDGQSIGKFTSLARLSREGRRRGIALVRYTVLQERPPLALGPAAEPVVSLFPLATDLGAGAP